ncbi:hypothetical protein [Endozoicomonas montiporae]|nr:hypothetical protein [Endozoicomonas montiporae]
MDYKFMYVCSCEAFALAATCENGQWFRHNDKKITAVDDVKHEEGTPYLLSYKVVDMLPDS